MILSTSLRQQPARRVAEAVSTSTLLKRSSPSYSRTQRRAIHDVPPLAHGKEFAENGIGKMLSADGFNLAWEQQQAYYLSRVNQMTHDTAESHTPLRTLLTKTSRSAPHASLFNHASAAHNNHAFFSTLSPTPTPPSAPLLSQITTSFSSLSSLRQTMLAHASAMFGPGYTWLVARHEPYNPYASAPVLALLNTYGAGTPYPEAHWRRQARDVSTHGEGGEARGAQVFALEMGERGRGGVGLHSRGMGEGQGGQGEGTGGSGQGSGVGGLAGANKGKALGPAAQDLDVLLCVSTWEHVWLMDHGVGGKRRFLEAWWDCIDWRVVEQRFSGADVAKERRKGEEDRARVGAGVGVGAGGRVGRAALGG